jgi:hypothetical protein
MNIITTNNTPLTTPALPIATTPTLPTLEDKVNIPEFSNYLLSMILRESQTQEYFELNVASIFFEFTPEHVIICSEVETIACISTEKIPIHPSDVDTIKQIVSIVFITNVYLISFKALQTKTN